MKNNAVFRFKPFSRKQRKILNWWCDNSPVKDKNGIIADGAIRSGKTIAMSLSFVMWSMSHFNGSSFAMCGKTIGSFRRNVLFWLKLMLRSRGYSLSDKRTDNLVIVSRGNVENYFYIFGGKDERSQDLIQGITLAGLFCDEVALMPKSFVDQAVARCSVDGSKYWFNCNPANPHHWFKTEWIDKVKDKSLLYLHFTMEDNLSLSELVKERYRTMYSGVFFKRYILGMWVAAEGVIYSQYADAPERFACDSVPRGEILRTLNIGLDFGGNGSKHALVCTAITDGYKKVYPLRSERKDPVGVTPQQLYEWVYSFCEDIQNRYGAVDALYADSAEQTLIAGLKVALNPLGITVKNSLKRPINDRIRATTLLMGGDRFCMVAPECQSLHEALLTALWDDKAVGADKRLDNGTSDIDTLDAFEYSLERHFPMLIKEGKWHLTN